MPQPWRTVDPRVTQQQAPRTEIQREDGMFAEVPDEYNPMVPTQGHSRVEPTLPMGIYRMPNRPEGVVSDETGRDLPYREMPVDDPSRFPSEQRAAQRGVYQLQYGQRPTLGPESASSRLRSVGGFRRASGYAQPVDDRGLPMPVIDLSGYNKPDGGQQRHEKRKPGLIESWANAAPDEGWSKEGEARSKISELMGSQLSPEGVAKLREWVDSLPGGPDKETDQKARTGGGGRAARQPEQPKPLPRNQGVAPGVSSMVGGDVGRALSSYASGKPSRVDPKKTQELIDSLSRRMSGESPAPWAQSMARESRPVNPEELVSQGPDYGQNVVSEYQAANAPNMTPAVWPSAAEQKRIKERDALMDDARWVLSRELGRSVPYDDPMVAERARELQDEMAGEETARQMYRRMTGKEMPQGEALSALLWGGK